jgi:hypothetical protein
VRRVELWVLLAAVLTVATAVVARCRQAVAREQLALGEALQGLDDVARRARAAHASVAAVRDAAVARRARLLRSAGGPGAETAGEDQLEGPGR